MSDLDRPGLDVELRASLSLLDYRRRVAGLYAAARAAGAGEAGWRAWRAARDDLFRTHPQSPIPPDRRPGFPGLGYFPYDPALRFVAPVMPARGGRVALPHSGDGTTPGRAFGAAAVTIDGRQVTMTLFRLDQYGDAVFVPFRDTTNGSETYGGGRYLLDTAKGADLGGDDHSIVLDFNYAFHPSCVHDPRWSCPLAPPENRLPVAVRGGERLGAP